jgi:hypothetical protein
LYKNIAPSIFDKLFDIRKDEKVFYIAEINEDFEYYELTLKFSRTESKYYTKIIKMIRFS